MRYEIGAEKRRGKNRRDGTGERLQSRLVMKQIQLKLKNRLGVN